MSEDATEDWGTDVPRPTSDADISTYDLSDCDSSGNCSSFYRTILSADMSRVCTGLLSVEVVVGLFGNALVCYAVKRNRSLRTPINLLIANLCVADLGMTILCSPLLLAILGSLRNCLEAFHRELVRVFEIVYILCSSVQLFTLVAISFERYQAIAKPFDKVARQRRINFILIASWVIGIFNCLIAVSVFHFFPSKDDLRAGHFVTLTVYFHFFVTVFLPFSFVSMFTIMALYFLIIYLVQKHVRQAKNKFGCSTNKVAPEEFNDSIAVSHLIADVYANVSKSLKEMPKTKASVERQRKRPPSAKPLVPTTQNHLTTTVANGTSETYIEGKGQNNSTEELHKHESNDNKENIGDTKEVSPPVPAGGSPEASGNTEQVRPVEDTILLKVSPPANHTQSNLLKVQDGASAGTDLPNQVTNTLTPPSNVKKEASNKDPQNNISDQKPNNISDQKPNNISDQKPEIQLVRVCDIDGTSKSVAVVTERSDVVGSICLMNNSNKERGKRRVETRTAKITAIVIVFFIVCAFPFPVVLLYSRLAFAPTITVSTTRNDVYILSLSLAILAAAINPITYGLFNKQFRHEFRRIVNKHFKRFYQTKPKTKGKK